MFARTRQLNRIETGLEDVCAALAENAAARAEVLARLDSLNRQVSDLAGAVRDVLAARNETDDATLAVAKRAATAAEAAFVGVQTLAAVATGPQPALKAPPEPVAGEKTAARGMGRRIPPKDKP